MLTLQDLNNYLVFIAVDKKGLSKEMLAITEGTKLIICGNFIISNN